MGIGNRNGEGAVPVNGAVALQTAFYADVSTLADRQFLTLSNTSSFGFGITTNAYHLSDNPDAVGTLQGSGQALIVGQATDLYLVGASSDGPGGPGIEHNGTVNGMHIRVTWDGETLDIQEIEYKRDHPGPGNWATRSFNSIIPTVAVTNQGGDLELLFSIS